MRLCTITLAGPPRGKGRGRAVATVAGARVYTDAKTRTYEAQLRFAGMQAMAGRAPSQAPIRLTMTVCFAVPAGWSRRKRVHALAGLLWPTIKPDADNVLKLTDSLNGVCWVDDKQIVSVAVDKFYAESPGLVIEVHELRASITADELIKRQPLQAAKFWLDEAP